MSIYRFYPSSKGAATVGFLTVNAEAFQEIERENSSCSVFSYEYVVTAPIYFTFIDQHGTEIAHANNATDLYVWRNSDNELRYDFEINDLEVIHKSGAQIDDYTSGLIDGLAGGPAEAYRAMKNAIYDLMRDSSFRELLHAALNDFEKEFNHA